MKKKWKLITLKMERDKKFRQDFILLILSAVILIIFVSLMMFYPKKHQVEKFEETTSHSAFVSTSHSDNNSTLASELDRSSEVSTTETVSQEENIQLMIEEFIGGWESIESEVFFFINSDDTISTIALDGTIVNSSMENLYLYYTEDGRSVLSYLVNGIQEEWLKETDGTLVNDGQVYQKLGDMTIEQYLNGYGLSEVGE